MLDRSLEGEKMVVMGGHECHLTTTQILLLRLFSHLALPSSLQRGMHMEKEGALLGELYSITAGFPPLAIEGLSPLTALPA